MTLYRERQRKTLFYRLLSGFVAVNFLLHSAVPGYSQTLSQTVLNLPVPGTMVTPSPAFHPALITGITVYPENPAQFDFIIDIGDDRLQGEALRQESQKLINYFMAALTVPEDELWVNLSPYEKDRIIASGLSQTEMGRDMLAQDYLLKQLTASLMYPEDQFGQEFWKRIYEKAYTQYGTTEIPMNTFNKVWIVPEKAVVYVHDGSVFVAESHLKVMLEEDYLALETNAGSTTHGLGKVTKEDLKPISAVAAQIIREVLLPEIEKEVNEGKNFANLRQIYHSMILATWYKKNLKESLLGKIYIDRNKVVGIDIEDKQIKDKIYDQYLEAFKKGVYNYIKEDYSPATKEMIPRKYFSGGLRLKGVSVLVEQEGFPASLAEQSHRPQMRVEAVSSPVFNGGFQDEEFYFKRALPQMKGHAQNGAFDPALKILRNMIEMQRSRGNQETQKYVDEGKNTYFLKIGDQIASEVRKREVDDEIKKDLEDMDNLQIEIGNPSTQKIVDSVKRQVFGEMLDDIRNALDSKSFASAKRLFIKMDVLKQEMGKGDTSIENIFDRADQLINRMGYYESNKVDAEGKKLEDMFFSNFYKILGVELTPGARPRDIKPEAIEAAWQRRNEEFNNKRISSKAIEIVEEAYKTLKDPDKRAEYDNKYENRQSSSPVDMDSLFKQLQDLLKHTKTLRSAYRIFENMLDLEREVKEQMRKIINTAKEDIFAAYLRSVKKELDANKRSDAFRLFEYMMDLQAISGPTNTTRESIAAAKNYFFEMDLRNIEAELTAKKLSAARTILKDMIAFKDEFDATNQMEKRLRKARILISNAEKNGPPINRDPKGHYKTLGISPDATESEINSAFKKKRLEKKIVDLKAFETLRTAHRVLINPQKRSDYDPGWMGSSPVAENPDYGGIDFNPRNMELKQQGEKAKFDFSIPEIDFDPAVIQGIRPVIINVTPVINFPLLLGLSQQNEKTI